MRQIVESRGTAIEALITRPDEDGMVRPERKQAEVLVEE
jgi:hypothetical protein